MPNSDYEQPEQIVLQRMQNYKIVTKEIEIEHLHDNHYQTRLPMFEKPGAIENLAVSIATRGMIELPKVRHHPKKGPEEYEVLCGHRRILAVREQLHWKKVRCEVYENISEDDVYAIVLIDNVHRDMLNPYEEGRAYNRYAQEMAHNKASKPEEIATLLSLPVKRIIKMMDTATTVDTYSKYVRREIFDTVVPKLTARHIEALRKLKMGSPDYVEALNRIGKGATSDEIDEFVNFRLNLEHRRDPVSKTKVKKLPPDRVKTIQEKLNKVRRKIPEDEQSELDDAEKEIHLFIVEKEELLKDKVAELEKEIEQLQTSECEYLKQGKCTREIQNDSSSGKSGKTKGK